MKKLMGIMSTLTVMFGVVVAGAWTFNQAPKSLAADTINSCTKVGSTNVVGAEVIEGSADPNDNGASCDVEVNMTIGENITLKLSGGTVDETTDPDHMKIELPTPSPADNYLTVAANDLVATVHTNYADGFSLGIQGTNAYKGSNSSGSAATQLCEASEATGTCIDSISTDSEAYDTNNPNPLGTSDEWWGYAIDGDSGDGEEHAVDTLTDVDVKTIPSTLTTLHSEAAAAESSSHIRFLAQVKATTAPGTYAGGLTFTAIGNPEV
jgi:hypothetical protein